MMLIASYAWQVASLSHRHAVRTAGKTGCKGLLPRPQLHVASLVEVHAYAELAAADVRGVHSAGACVRGDAIDMPKSHAPSGGLCRGGPS